MNNPTPEKFREMGEFFLHLTEAMPEIQLNMMETDFHPGTVACVAGTYAAFKLGEKVRYDYDYCHGADRLSVELGFEDGIEMRVWAENAVEVWGNSNG